MLKTQSKGGIDVLALTGGLNVPSSRLRIRQHTNFLFSKGIAVTEIAQVANYRENSEKTVRLRNDLKQWPSFLASSMFRCLENVSRVAKSYQFDIVWLERGLFVGVPTFEPLLKTPLAFDIDDAVWLCGPFGRTQARVSVQRASIVLAGNSFLADWCGQYCPNVRIVPTAVDTDRYYVKSKNERTEFVVGWIGTSGNFPYIYNIEKPLLRLMQENARVVLKIVADSVPKFTQIPNEKIRFVRWSADTEVQEVQDMDVGIMPLPDSDWARGKCSYKMLQYMACGLPVVVSPIGMNLELLRLGTFGYGCESETEWYEALTFLEQNFRERNIYGAMGRKIVEEGFSTSAVSRQIASVFRSIV